jgi:hypothetical protein
MTKKFDRKLGRVIAIVEEFSSQFKNIDSGDVPNPVIIEIDDNILWVRWLDKNLWSSYYPLSDLKIKLWKLLKSYSSCFTQVLENNPKIKNT